MYVGVDTDSFKVLYGYTMNLTAGLKILFLQMYSLKHMYTQ